VLLRPGLPVRIPDAVYIETTRVHGAADHIVASINDRLDAVRIVSKGAMFDHTLNS
jgi:hypothetical protein